MIEILIVKGRLYTWASDDPLEERVIDLRPYLRPSGVAWPTGLSWWPRIMRGGVDA